MRFDWSGRRQAGQGYEMANVVRPVMDGDGPAESESQTAGGARRAAETGPNEDRDNWQQFSKEDARKLANDPATPVDAEIPKGGQSRDGGRVD